MAEFGGRTVDEFPGEIAAAGGGAAAAMTAALAAACVALAARTGGGSWEDAPGFVAQAESLRTRAAKLAEANAEAYARARAKLERGGDRLGPSLLEAAAVPRELADLAADVALLAAETAERADPKVQPDARAGALLAAAASRAAAELVAANLTALPGDERVTRARERAGDAARAAERALEA